MNFDMAATYEAYLELIEDDQASNGDVPVVVPDTATRDTPKTTPGCNDIALTAAYPLITNMQHTYYGNTRTLEQRWPSLVRCARSHIASRDSLHMICTATFVRNLMERWLIGLVV